jgi:lipoprotein LprG
MGRAVQRVSVVVPVVRLLLVGAVLVGGVAACNGGKSGKGGDQGGSATANLPAADELLKSSADTMRSVQTAHFDIQSDGDIGGIPLRRANGDITRAGDAQGTAQLDQALLAELSFVVKGQTLYIKGVTGGWQKLPLSLASSVYDPSKILDPDRGAANVVATATSAKTEAREAVDGTDAYRVAATVKGTALGQLVPGIDTDLAGQLWIGADRKLLLKGKFVVPGQNGGKSGTVTITFSKFDAPVTVNEP